MVANSKKAPEAQEASISKELDKIPYEPLLPVEIKLIVWSLALGLALMGLLVWISSTFFAPASSLTDR